MLTYACVGRRGCGWQGWREPTVGEWSYARPGPVTVACPQLYVHTDTQTHTHSHADKHTHRNALSHTQMLVLMLMDGWCMCVCEQTFRRPCARLMQPSASTQPTRFPGTPTYAHTERECVFEIHRCKERERESDTSMHMHPFTHTRIHRHIQTGNHPPHVRGRVCVCVV
jgi:hypothetical protein